MLYTSGATIFAPSAPSGFFSDVGFQFCGINSCSWLTLRSWIIGEPYFGINALVFTGREEGIDHSPEASGLGCLVAAGEEVVFAPDGHGSDNIFHEVIVDFKIFIGKEQLHVLPAASEILANRKVALDSQLTGVLVPQIANSTDDETAESTRLKMSFCFWHKELFI